MLVYFSVNIAVIRAFRTEFRDQFRLGRHLLIPATASVIFLFPLWGIVHPPAYTLVNLLPFAALGWLCLGSSPLASCGSGGPQLREMGHSLHARGQVTSRSGLPQPERGSVHWLTIARQPNRPRLGAGHLPASPRRFSHESWLPGA